LTTTRFDLRDRRLRNTRQFSELTLG
jgi:hypothetical protein